MDPALNFGCPQRTSRSTGHRPDNRGLSPRRECSPYALVTTSLDHITSPTAPQPLVTRRHVSFAHDVGRCFCVGGNAGGQRAKCSRTSARQHPTTHHPCDSHRTDRQKCDLIDPQVVRVYVLQHGIVFFVRGGVGSGWVVSRSLFCGD